MVFQPALLQDRGQNHLVEIGRAEIVVSFEGQNRIEQGRGQQPPAHPQSRRK